MKLRIPAFVKGVSPTVWIIGLVIFAGLFGAAGMMTPRIGPFTFDPFNRQAVRLRDAKAAEARANSDAAARGLEVQGEREQAQRVDTFHRQVVEIHTITAEAVSQARSAPDANEHLPTDRLDRLRAHDGELCALSPASCAGRASEAGDAGGG